MTGKELDQALAGLDQALAGLVHGLAFRSNGTGWTHFLSRRGHVISYGPPRMSTDPGPRRPKRAKETR